MKLAELIDGTDIRLIGGSASVEIRDVTEDSRTTGPGSLFFARRGESADGRAFIPDVIARGAAAVLLEEACPVESESAAVLLASDPARSFAHLAERISGNPSARLRLIGITGTNGKTTTAFLIRHILNTSGMRCGLMGTVLIDDGRAETTAALTTPAAADISRTLARMVANCCEAAVMEVSSHALVQKRVAGLQFASAVFTNLSGDHLDYHDSMEAYAEAKSLLFRTLDRSATAVINIDDPWSETIARSTAAKVIRCGIQSAQADCTAIIHELGAACSVATLTGPWGRVRMRIPLVGRHNVANALQAAAIAHAMGVTRDNLKRGLETCAAPTGRLEPVTDAGAPFSVLVDYAHADAALENVLAAVRPIVPTGGRLCVVFGCGGDRDRTKRPRMARAACAGADRVIITTDNPRTEDPRRIIEEILRGVPAPDRDRVTTIENRREAIFHAISHTRPGDVLLIAGKGHEDYQIVGSEKFPFDDRAVARAAIEERLGSVVTA